MKKGLKIFLIVLAVPVVLIILLGIGVIIEGIFIDNRVKKEKQIALDEKTLFMNSLTDLSPNNLSNFSSLKSKLFFEDLGTGAIAFGWNKDGNFITVQYYEDNWSGKTTEYKTTMKQKDDKVFMLINEEIVFPFDSFTSDAINIKGKLKVGKYYTIYAQDIDYHSFPLDQILHPEKDFKATLRDWTVSAKKEIAKNKAEEIANATTTTTTTTTTRSSSTSNVSENNDYSRKIDSFKKLLSDYTKYYEKYLETVKKSGKDSTEVLLLTSKYMDLINKILDLDSELVDASEENKLSSEQLEIWSNLHSQLLLMTAKML